MQPGPKLTQSLVLCLAILPACLLLALIFKYSVDVPFLDQWEIAPFFTKLSEGTLSTSDLFRQQNEYRQFFPNLLFVALGWLTSWDVRYEMLISFLLACLVSFNIYRLSRITVAGNEWQTLYVFLISNLLIFSPIQYENWLFGIQVIYYVPIACLTGCLLIAYSNLSVPARYVACICLSTISSFSSANGLVCWLVALPALTAGQSWDDLKKKRWWISVWAMGLALSLVIYFYGYKNTSSTLGFAELLLNPLRAATYTLGFLGGPFGIGRQPLIIAAVAGIILTIAYILSWMYFIKSSTDGVLRRRLIPWLMIGAYSIITAVLVMFGRLTFGVEQSLSSRYTTYSLYLVVSLVHLVALILSDAKRRGFLRKSSAWIARSVSLAAVFLVVAQVPIYLLAIRNGMTTVRRQRLQAKACLLFINVVNDDCASSMYPHPSVLRRKANALDRLGFLRPPLLKSNRVEDLVSVDKEECITCGSFEIKGQAGGEAPLVSGWATPPEGTEPPDAVLLTYQNADADSVVFALAGVRIEKASDAEVSGGEGRAGFLWQKSFSLDKLPGRPIRINAWAFSVTTGKAYKLSGTHVIP